MKTLKRNETAFFDIINNGLMLLVAFICIYPFINILSTSISDGRAIMAGKVLLWPVGINAEAYEYVLLNPQFGVARGFVNSILYTVFGTAFAVAVTFMTGYVLSRKKFTARSVFMLLIMFTQVFDAGMIPYYIIQRALGLVNNPLIMILPGALSATCLLITRSFMAEVPVSLEEAAFLDGANDFQIFLKVFLPVSKPSIATISLFYAINRWNDFTTPLIYFRDENLKPLQLVLYNLVIKQAEDASLFGEIAKNGALINRNLQAATVILTVIPIVLVYPFIQRYFTKGIMIGAIKG
jgi:putative aldouronate transport system permease protein